MRQLGLWFTFSSRLDEEICTRAFEKEFQRAKVCCVRGNFGYSDMNHSVLNQLTRQNLIILLIKNFIRIYISSSSKSKCMLLKEL
jgi:hypothetical protein